MDETDKLLQERFEGAPEELREYISSPETREKLDQVLEGQPLQNKQRSAFGIEVMLVFLGIQSLGSFAMNIKHSMQISQSRADEIARNAKQALFTPVLEYLNANDTADNTETGPIASTDIVAPKRTESTAEPKHDAYREPIEDTKRPAETQTPQAPERLPDVEKTIKEEQQAAVLDVFKKRLSAPVHTPAREENVGKGERSEDRIANVDPSSKETLAKDPYRETIE